MAKKAKKVTNLNVAVERAYLITDGRFFYRTESGEIKPVPVIYHGVGAPNHSDKESGRAVFATESAKTGPDMETVIVSFSWRPLPLIGERVRVERAGDGELEPDEAHENLMQLRDLTKEKGLAKEISQRFAHNILSGRWLWRNARMAEKIKISVQDGDGDSIVEDYDPAELYGDRNTFELRPDEVVSLGEHIQSAWFDGENTAFNISAEVDFGFGGSIEVFPSQNYVPGLDAKGKDKGFSRSLYRQSWPEQYERPDLTKILPGDVGDMEIIGQAAFRDGKLWNALRTIDIEYPEYEKYGVAISIEPSGESRMGKMRASGQSMVAGSKLREKVLKGEFDDLTDEQLLFATACTLIRGGVYNDKSDKGDKS